MARLASGGAGVVVLIPPTLRVRGSTGIAAGGASAGDRGFRTARPSTAAGKHRRRQAPPPASTAARKHDRRCDSVG
jgi:hypothetical protein